MCRTDARQTVRDLEGKKRIFPNLSDIDLEFDRNGNLIKAKFWPRVFNAGDLSPETFARSLMDTYGIPKLFQGGSGDVIKDLIGAYWYRSPKGWQITIDRGKVVELQVVTATSELLLD